jgi:hypothetical protein
MNFSLLLFSIHIMYIFNILIDINNKKYFKYKYIFKILKYINIVYLIYYFLAHEFILLNPKNH